MNKIQILKEYLAEDLSDYQGYIFFSLAEKVGIISCYQDLEKSDNHCEQCANEILPFAFNTGLKEVSSYLSIAVGPTKFKRIIDGWKDSIGFDLNKIELIKD